MGFRLNGGFLFNLFQQIDHRIVPTCGLFYSDFRLPLSAITKARLFKYIENFTTKKGKFSDKKSDIFHISAPYTDCGYSLGPPQRGGSNEYPQSMFLAKKKKKKKKRKVKHTPVKSNFTI